MIVTKIMVGISIVIGAATLAHFYMFDEREANLRYAELQAKYHRQEDVLRGGQALINRYQQERRIHRCGSERKSLTECITPTDEQEAIFKK